ncbi:MAG: hypothetical protein M1399_01755 [Actinobacteria bacterium]|nr:hypothetical protein [Actinomycetota bacterium]
MSAVVGVSQGAVNMMDSNLLADLGVSASGNQAGNQVTQVGVGWPSPYLPVPFWMLVTDGVGWAWAVSGTESQIGSSSSAIANSLGLQLAGKPPASLLSTYL